jgi:hypothetical protein
MTSFKAQSGWPRDEDVAADKYLADLASKGITATKPQAVSQGRQRLATITDLDGNQLSLIEEVFKGR